MALTKDYTVLRQDSVPSNFYTKLLQDRQQDGTSDKKEPKSPENSYDIRVKAPDVKASSKIHSYDNNFNNNQSVSNKGNGKSSSNISTAKGTIDSSKLTPSLNKATGNQADDNALPVVPPRNNITAVSLLDAVKTNEPNNANQSSNDPNYHKYLEIVPSEMNEIPSDKHVRFNQTNEPGNKPSEESKPNDLGTKSNSQNKTSGPRLISKTPIYIFKSGKNKSDKQLHTNVNNSYTQHVYTNRNNHHGRRNRQSTTPDENNNHITPTINTINTNPQVMNSNNLVNDPEKAFSYQEKSGLSRTKRLVLISSIVCLIIVIIAVAVVMAFVLTGNIGQQGSTKNTGNNGSNNSGGGSTTPGGNGGYSGGGGSG